MCLVLSVDLLDPAVGAVLGQSHADGDRPRDQDRASPGIETIPDGIQTKDAFDVLVAKFPTQSGAQSTAAGRDPWRRRRMRPIAAADPGARRPPSRTTPSFGEAAAAPDECRTGRSTLVSIPFAGEATDSQNEAAVDAITQSARHVRAAGVRRRTPACSSAVTRRS